MKRLTWIVAMTAVLGVAAYTIAGAQAPGRGQGTGPGGAGLPGPGEGPGVMLMLRGLDLSEDQRQQLRALRDSQRDAREAFAPERQLHRQLQAEIVAEVPDAQRIAELQRQILEAQTARLARQVEAAQQVAQVLTPEQRETLRERLARAPERRGAGGRRGPGAGL